MMAMAIIDLGKQEKTMIRTIYKHEWMQALGFSCIAHSSSFVNLKSAN
jgi:hypothetical protein